MSNLIYRKKWEDFTEKYSQHFKSNEEQWDENLEAVCNYIDEYKKRPSSASKDKNTKYLGLWLSHQNTNYKKKLSKSIIAPLAEKIKVEYLEEKVKLILQ